LYALCISCPKRLAAVLPFLATSAASTPPNNNFYLVPPTVVTLHSVAFIFPPFFILRITNSGVWCNWGISIVIF